MLQSNENEVSRQESMSAHEIAMLFVERGDLLMAEKKLKAAKKEYLALKDYKNYLKKNKQHSG